MDTKLRSRVWFRSRSDVKPQALFITPTVKCAQGATFAEKPQNFTCREHSSLLRIELVFPD